MYRVDKVHLESANTQSKLKISKQTLELITVNSDNLNNLLNIQKFTFLLRLICLNLD